jgi:tetratricopeptide (TPR) repeat protein
MPVRDYMVVDPRYDHSFRIPRPDLTVKIGTPNACTDCHADQTAEWADAAVTEWYGDARTNEPHYAEAIHAGRNWRPEAGPRLISTIEDPSIPGIVRATALSLVRNYPNPNVFEAVRDSLQDDDPLVRREAAETLMLFEPEVRTRLGAAVLSDPVRTVRLAAARSLADVPRNRLDIDQRAALKRGLEEYASAQHFNEDRAAGRMNLGWFYAQKGQLDQAERVYRSAIQIAPTFSAAAINLADLFRVQGRDEEGESVLRDALGRTPDDADLQHALGLTLVRQKRHEEALERLQRATALAPGRPRYAYVYGVALHSVGRTTEGLEALKIAHERHPGHADLVLTLATLSRDNGDSESAIFYARRLLELAPNHPGALGLLGQFGVEP